MAREKLSSEDAPVSEIVPIGELTDELSSWIKVSRSAAKKIALESEKAIKEIKEGQIVIVEFDEKGAAMIVGQSKSSNKLALKWQKCGASILLTTPHHGGRVTRIYGSYSSRDLPIAKSFRASVDTTWSMLIDQGFSDTELFDFVIPKRTLDRRQSKKEPLTVEETDKALRLARIADLANTVFGDKEKAQRWLRKPKRSLDGETPVTYLSSEAGARVIEEMLMRIDAGILA